MTRKGSQVQVLYGPPDLISEYALNMHPLASAVRRVREFVQQVAR
jgi:hypothetical protein